VSELVGENRTLVRKSRFGGADTVDFDSTPLEGGRRQVLNGSVEGTLPEIAKFVQSMSELMPEASVEHVFEVYDADQNLVKEIPESEQTRE
jgi:hypothetical protein